MQAPDSTFITQWHTAARTSVGLFWSAFWAFGLGYLVSSIIQLGVTRDRMRAHLGKTTPKTVSLAAFFGFISSSCSFAALSTPRALFSKGAALVPSLAFLLASTNLVVELGIVIAMFLVWQFVVAEYVGGVLLILFVWLLAWLSRGALGTSWSVGASTPATPRADIITTLATTTLVGISPPRARSATAT